MTDEGTDFADDPLASEADHEGGAVVAFQRRAESADQKLVRLSATGTLQKNETVVKTKKRLNTLFA